MDDGYEFGFLYRGYQYRVHIEESTDGHWTTKCMIYNVPIPVDETPATCPLDAIQKGSGTAETFINHFIQTQERCGP